MRLPRHATPASLSAEAPREALARDEALLAQVGDAPLVRWYRVTSPALVLGLALHHRRQEVVDFEHCRAAGVEVLDRAAGGGAVLLDQGMLCCTVATPNAESDLTESYRWLGVHFAQRLALRRVEVAEARADVAALREAKADLVLNACYGALSPHEVVDQRGAKVVGFAQVRRQHAALFQIGILLRDQSGLADLLNVPDEASRNTLRNELRQRSAALQTLLSPRQLVQLLQFSAT
jgi:lipoate-protein ligase A